MSLLNQQQLAALSDGEKRRRILECLLEATTLQASLKDPDEGPEWIKVNEAARVSGMTRNWFYDHWREIPQVFEKRGGSLLANRRALMRWIEARTK